MTLLALDLFSGTGAATAAFSIHGWEVIRIDNDPKLRPDLIADVRKLPIMCKPDFIWASPPCQGYSLAARRDRVAVDLELWEAAIAAIRELAPRHWVIENVRGACRYWGIPAVHWGPYYLWANFRIRPPRSVAPEKMRVVAPRRQLALERARIPAELSRAVYASLMDERRPR
jgi:hypothetical protein